MKPHNFDRFIFWLLYGLIISIIVSGSCTRWALSQESAPWSTIAIVPNVGTTIELHPTKNTLITFFVTTCPHCQAEVEVLNTIHNSGYPVIGVITDIGNVKGIIKFFKAFKPSYPVVLHNHDLLVKFGEVPTVPTSFIIGSNGDILKRWEGHQDFETYLEWLQI